MRSSHTIKSVFKFAVLLLLMMSSAFLGGYVALNLRSISQGSEVVMNSEGVSSINESSDTELVTLTTGEDNKSAQILSLSDQPVVKIAKQLGPSVVGITSKQRVQTWGRYSEVIEQDYSTGTGFVIDSQGHIVTNNHVIDGADSVVVTLQDGKEVNAQIVGTDAKTDLAVLKIDEPNLTPVKLGDSSIIQPGEFAFAIGNPLGLELAGSITMGIISGIERTLDVDGRELNFIQTDAAINPGNSGGPLINLQGEVIGINTMKETSAGNVSVEGIGFAIPINEAKPIIEELIEKGYVSRPGIGITMYEITERDAREYGVPQGIYVYSVLQRGPAQKAGILPGDILISFDGKAIKTSDQLSESINKHKVGDIVQIKVWRNGVEKTFNVQLGQLSQ